MLRRKFILVLAPLVGLLVLTAVLAVWSLQRLLRDFDHINTEAWQVVERVNQFSIKVHDIELQLHRIQRGEERHLDALILAVENARTIVSELDGHYVMHEPEVEANFQSILHRLPDFERHVGALATTEDPGIRHARAEAFLQSASQLRHDTLPLSRHVRMHARMEQEELVSGFRWVLLGLTILFLIVINASVIILLKMAGMILRPVAKLVDATRQIGQDRLDHRVSIEEHDEFGELATALNEMARRLGENEQRRMELLMMAARTLNHELNNCITIIQMQLQLMGRQTRGSGMAEDRLKEIGDSLQRMNRTVASLLQIRRIVLTDYTPGVKMLDLERSVCADEPKGERSPSPIG
jgi:signal transduction histidine kinase